MRLGSSRTQPPILGVCLGSQLLARALGGEVRRGERPGIGFAPVEIADPTDRLVGALAPSMEARTREANLIERTDPGFRACADLVAASHPADHRLAPPTSPLD